VTRRQRDRQFLERVLEGIFVYADGTIVLRFQQDSLFAPVRAYEFHPDHALERGTVADRWFHGLNSGHAADLAKSFEGAELRVVEQKGGPRFRLSALRSPPLHTVSVPRGSRMVSNGGREAENAVALILGRADELRD